MDSSASTEEHQTPQTDNSVVGDRAGDARGTHNPLGGEHPHEWYDDDFCAGGGAFVGKGKPQVVCPICGESMDVDDEGYLFKHRPRIPGNTH